MCLLQLLGRGLAQLPRDQIYVATKVGKYKAGEPEDIFWRACQAECARISAAAW